MKKTTIFFACILALSLIAIAVAQNSKITMKVVKDCKTIEWETEEPIIGTCTEEVVKRICDDPPINKSCYDDITYYEYDCITGYDTMYHSEEICTPSSFEITKEAADVVTEKGSINFEGWGKCSYQQKDQEIIITCDSKYDGNNDGICQSGESCTKFVVSHEKVEKFIKNSQEEFTSDDKSFFLEKLDYEVMTE